MQVKVEILIALFFARNQGGADAEESFFTFARKHMKKQTNTFNMENTLSTLLMKSPQTVLEHLKSDPTSVKACISAFMAIMQPLQPANNYKADGQGFAEDLMFKKMRAVVLAIIDSPDCDTDLRELCVRVLLVTGTVRASAEDILHAALLQQKYKIDVSSDLDFFCKQSEVFKKPLGDAKSGEYERTDSHTV